MEEKMKEKMERFYSILQKSSNIVFFGGAGVSTESGIPDFRSVDGLYHQSYKYPPETILSHSFFIRNREEFYRFYWDKMICTSAKPNITHTTLAELEKAGKLKAVITQNIDGLHQLAGSKEVLELHGSVHRNFCTSCGKPYTLEELLKLKENEEKKEIEENKENVFVPHCSCGGIIKPDVVLYEESLNEETIEKSIQYISEADTLIIGGTSLSVYPAAGFIRYFRGQHLILINKSQTPYDKNADLVMNCGLGEVFSKVNVDNL